MGRLAKHGSASCAYKGGQICNGAVIQLIGRRLVRVCEDGVIQYRDKKLIGDDYPVVGRDTGRGKGRFIIVINYQ